MTGRLRKERFCARHQYPHLDYRDPECQLLTDPQLRLLKAIRMRPQTLNDRKVQPLRALERAGLIVVDWDMRPQTKGSGIELVGQNTACAKRTAKVGIGQVYPNSVLNLDKKLIESAMEGTGYKIAGRDHGWWLIEGVDTVEWPGPVKVIGRRKDITLDAVFARLADHGIGAEETTKWTRGPGDHL